MQFHSVVAANGQKSNYQTKQNGKITSVHLKHLISETFKLGWRMMT